MQFDGGTHLGMHDSAAQRFDEAARCESTGALLVLSHPLRPRRHLHRIDRPDAGARPHVRRDAGAPGLGGEPRAKALLVQAHLPIHRVDTEAREAFRHFELTRVERACDASTRIPAGVRYTRKPHVGCRAENARMRAIAASSSRVGRAAQKTPEPLFNACDEQTRDDE